MARIKHKHRETIPKRQRNGSRRSGLDKRGLSLQQKSQILEYRSLRYNRRHLQADPSKSKRERVIRIPAHMGKFPDHGLSRASNRGSAQAQPCSKRLAIV